MQIEVDGLTKEFGAFRAGSDLSFAVERGAVLGFLGPNGAGKTTTMRILAGYISATSGTARIAGHDVLRESLASRRKIGYLPESVPIYPEMRAIEYLRYQARMKDVPRRALASAVGYVIERCGVSEYSRKLVSGLSKGMRQRLGLAATLVHKPEVIILDEPTIGLDPNQIVEIRKLIRGLGGSRTVILSTHILSEVESVCNRVLVIHRGRLRLFDSIESITGRQDTGPLLRLEVEGPGEETERRLRALPQVRGVRRSSDGPRQTFHVECEQGMDERDLRRAVSQAATSAGGVILDFRSERTSLEDVFRRLTREEG